MIRARLLVGLAGVLAAADLISFWSAPPGGRAASLVIPAAVVGAGLAFVGATAWQQVRASAAPVLLLLAGVVLLTTPLLLATGAPRAAACAGVAGAALLAPLALATIVDPPRARRTSHALLVVLSAAGATAAVSAYGRAHAVTVPLVLLVGCALFAVGWLQFEVTSGQPRRRVLWLVLGLSTSVPFTLMLLVALDGATVDEVVVSLAVSLLGLPIPVCAWYALMAPDARDIRSVMSRTVLAAVMTTLVVSLFSAGAAALSAGTAGAPSVGLLGLLAAALAAGYHPVLVQARTTIDELLFGGRPDPVVTLSRLGEQLSEGTEPAEWLESLRRALAVRGLLLRRDHVVLAQAGEQEGTVTSVHLRVGALVAGSLEVTLPPEQVQLPPTTRAVLQLVSTPLAQAVHAAHLTEQLQRSRVQVVGVLEDERRRMRRDLHDGLGPTLTGVAYTADAAANLVGTDPVQASELLRQLRTDVGDALSEIRRIVYGLRPRALDELGLVRAVQQGAERLRTAQGRPFAVTTSAPPLPELPAAVEVVAYRVAVEALTNAARHAHVEGARLELSVGDCLELVVSDDGRSDGAWSEGVGIASMRERVAQVGGVLEVGGGSNGGRVRAELPLRWQQGLALPAQSRDDASMASRSRTA